MKKKLNLGLRYIKSYKTRSVAIILSMVLSIGLIVGMGILSRTNDYAELQKMKYNTGIHHVEIGRVNGVQVEEIRKNKNIESLGLFTLNKYTAKEEKQNIPVISANKDYIKSNSKIVKGRYPKSENEIVAETWVLRNLGIEPQINKEITLKMDDFKGGYIEEKFELVGIINDRPSEKSYGRMALLTNLEIYDDSLLNANIAFKSGSDIYGEIDKIKKSAKLDEEYIDLMDDLIAIESSVTSLDIKSVEFVLFISLICGIVIYGIFNISIYKRISEYGILRAVGANNFKIFKLVLEELFTLFLISVPVGLLIGFTGAIAFGNLAEKIETTVILNGEAIKIGMKFPMEIIVGSIISIGIIVILISFLTYRKIRKLSVIDSIKNNLSVHNVKKSIISVKFLSKFMNTYQAISFKNMFRNKKSFVMIIVSMSICGILLITLNYRSYLSQSDDFAVEKSMNMNSDFMIDIYNEDKREGLSEEDLNEIEKIDGVKNTETSMIMYSRMVMDEKDILDKGYFDYINNGFRGEGLFKGYLVEDKKTNELIMKNNLRGYDDNALNKLKDYVENGEIDIAKMKKENLAVVYIPKSNKENVESLGRGNVVDIKVGDTVKLKFREDRKVDEAFYTMEDTESKYEYKEFKVGAIVSYEYMSELYHTSSTCADVIVSEEIFEKITGINKYSSINVNMNEGADHKKIEKNIAKITSTVKGAMLRDIVAEKENTKAMHEKSRLYNMGITCILFVITVVNVVNNISHSIMCRTSEFGMLRAVGLNTKDFKKMIIFEGLLYGVVSSFIVVIISLMLQIIIYKNFMAADLGIAFEIRYIDYLLVIGVNLILGTVSTYLPSKKLEERSIVEAINIID